MKDVLILTYDGNVLLENFPNNYTNSKILELTRQELQKALNKPIIDLYNVEKLVNSDITKFKEKEPFYGEFPTDFITATIDYNNL